MQDNYSEESIFDPDGTFKNEEEGGPVNTSKYKDQNGISISRMTEYCGEENVYIPLKDDRTIKITKPFDDSNYFLLATPETEKDDIEGLLYPNTLKKWKDVDEMIKSIEPL